MNIVSNQDMLLAECQQFYGLKKMTLVFKPDIGLLLEITYILMEVDWV